MKFGTIDSVSNTSLTKLSVAISDGGRVDDKCVHVLYKGGATTYTTSGDTPDDTCTTDTEIIVFGTNYDICEG